MFKAIKSSQYKWRSANIVEDIQFHFGEVSEPIESQEVMYLQVPKVSRVNFEERSIVVAGPLKVMEQASYATKNIDRAGGF